MKLRGIPAELRVGPVDLRVVGSKCALLQPCMHCGLYNRVYFLCKTNHVTCFECFLIDWSSNKLSRPQYEGYCKGCNVRVILYRIEIPISLLQSIELMCGCGFTGKLAEIRQHVKSDGISVQCAAELDEPRPSSDEFDVEVAKLHSDVTETINDFLSQLYNIKEKYAEKFEDKASRQLEPSVYTLKYGENVLLQLGLLNKRIKDIKRDLLKLRRSSYNITPLIQDRFGRMWNKPQPRPDETDRQPNPPEAEHPAANS